MIMLLATFIRLLNEAPRKIDSRTLYAMSQDDVRAFADRELRLLGEGSSRRTYLWDSKRVLKVAFRPQGFVQNKGEIDTWRRAQGKPHSNLLARIFDHAGVNTWLIMELVRPLRDPAEFERMAGIPFDFAAGVLEYGHIDSYWARDLEADPDTPEEDKMMARLWSNDEMRSRVLELRARIEGLGVHTVDMISLEHWAKGADGRLTILDYGLTHDNVVGYEFD